MSPSTVLYHMRPPCLRGTSLVPLNALHEIDPDLHAQGIAKYRGREAIPERPLPELNCRWGDCVQFSTVHPAMIRAAFIDTGHDWPRRGIRFLVVDADRAGFTTDDTAIWLYKDAGPTTDMAAAKTDVVPYTADRIAHLTTLHDRTVGYLREMKAADRRPFLFVGIPHVLHRGAVSLDHMGELVI